MSRRLHVLVVPAWYPSPEDPVAGVFVRDQARAVAQRHEVTVLAPPSAAAPSVALEEGVRVLRLPAARSAGRLAVLEQLRAIGAAVARLRREGRPPDVVHAHVFSSGLLAVLVARRRRLPVVVSEHDTDVMEHRLTAWTAFLARFTYRHADLVCPVSPLLARSMVRLEPRGRYEVVANVVDFDAFAGPPRARRGPGRRVLTVASLTPYKGMPHLLEAFRLLVRDRPEVTLEIVGDGPERAVLEAIADGLPVTFAGGQPRATVAARMREADVLALPSVAETFGIAAVEALAAGLPVVATTACGAADVVAAHGGLVVPPADPPALRDALATLLDRPGSVPAATAEELRQTYGAAAIAERWDAVYRSLHK